MTAAERSALNPTTCNVLPVLTSEESLEMSENGAMAVCRSARLLVLIQTTDQNSATPNQPTVRFSAASEQGRDARFLNSSRQVGRRSMKAAGRRRRDSRQLHLTLNLKLSTFWDDAIG